MRFWRHLFAMMGKEWYNWKQKLFVNLLYALLPFALMSLLFIVKYGLPRKLHRAGPDYDSDTVSIDLRNNSRTMQDFPNAGLTMMRYFSNETTYPRVLGVVTNGSDFAQEVVNYLETFNIKAKTFRNETAMLEYAGRHLKENPVKLSNLTTGLSFVRQGEDDEYKYKLFLDEDYVPDVSSNFVDLLQSTPNFWEWDGIVHSGIFFVKTVVDNLILKKSSNNPNASIIYSWTPLPYSKFREDGFESFKDYAIGLLFLISMLPPLVGLIGKLMDDKTSKMRDTLKIMGLSDSAYFCGYFIFYAILQAVVSYLSPLVIFYSLYPRTNYFLFSTFFFLFGLSLYPFGIIISSVFQSSLVAKIIGLAIFYLMALLPLPFVLRYNATAGLKIGASLVPQLALFLGLEVFTRADNGKFGINFSNITLIDSYGYKIYYSYLFFIIDFVIYLLVALYLDNVLPSQSGYRKPLHYFLQARYWGCTHANVEEIEARQEKVLLVPEQEEEKELPSTDEDFERKSSQIMGLEKKGQTLKIRNLGKAFGKKVAVQGINIDMHPGQIYALLGHNGAGKTTTVSMLNGMLRPTNGTATVFGIDLFNELSKIRDDLGVCPQEDALFLELTVEEHLKVLGLFKGASSVNIGEHIDRLLADFNLDEKRNTVAKDLSMGNRRKLSLTMSFLGNPRILFLDEPTAGMDSMMRKEVWGILKSYKRDRIILLTTHFMEEADELGDQIGIMVQGKLVCGGSSMFLKKKFGVGYHLKVTKLEEVNLSEDIISFVSKHIPGVEVTSDLGNQLELRLPFVDQEKYQTLFNELDENIEALAIRAYGVSITTLEDVFLRIGEKHGKLSASKMDKMDKSEPIAKNEGPHNASVFSLAENSEQIVLEQMKVVIKKKAREGIRSIPKIVFTLIAPFLLCLLAQLTYNASLKTQTHFYSLEKDFPDYPIMVNNESRITEVSTIQPLEMLEHFYSRTKKGLKVLNVKKHRNTVDDVIEQGYQASIDPNFYYLSSSFYFYESNVDRNQYAFVFLCDITCPQSTLAFSNELTAVLFDNPYQSIKKYVSFGIAQMRVCDPIKDYYAIQHEVSQFTNFFSLAMGLIPGLFAMHLLRESNRELKQHLLISGLPLWVYWVSYYIVDLINLYIPIVAIVITNIIMDIQIAYLGLYLLLFPPAQLSFIYLTSMFFTSGSTGYAVNTFFHLLVGMFAPTIVISFRFLPYLATLGVIATHILSLVPSFSAVWGLYIIATKETLGLQNQTEYGTFEWNIGLQPLIFLILSTPLYFSLLMLFEYSWKPRRQAAELAKKLPPYKYEYKKDENVELEAQVVRDTQPKFLRVRVQEVSKGYKSKANEENMKIAIHDISFTVGEGEILAILGPNGAGKTTLLKVLTNFLPQNKGEIHICGKPVTSDNSHTIGFSPDVLTLYSKLTVLDHFQFYAVVKGIPTEERELLINEVIANLELEEDRDKYPAMLSIGTKRKVTVGLALLGNPQVILLDEPTIGMDPQTRRNIWAMIYRISKRGLQPSFIVTTNSLDEAEALATNIAILINGTIRCIGNPQDIRQKYAVGYYIEVKFNVPSVESAKQFLDTLGVSQELQTPLDFVTFQRFLAETNMTSFGSSVKPDGELSELHYKFNTELSVPLHEIVKYMLFNKWKDQTLYTVTRECGETSVEYIGMGHFKYRVRLSNVSVAKMFGVIEELKLRIPILDYSVMQPTLEEVFRVFAEAGERERRKAEIGQNVTDDLTLEEMD